MTNYFNELVATVPVASYEKNSAAMVLRYAQSALKVSALDTYPEHAVRCGMDPERVRAMLDILSGQVPDGVDESVADKIRTISRLKREFDQKLVVSKVATNNPWEEGWVTALAWGGKYEWERDLRNA